MKRRALNVNTEDAVSVSSAPSRKKSPPSKVVVAISDLENVLKAIDEIMESEKKRAVAAEKSDAVQQTDTEDQDRTDNETQRRDDDVGMREDPDEEENPKAAFLAEIQNSLKERLYQIVQPIPDEHYHERVRRPYIQQQIKDEDEAEKRLIESENAKVKAEEDAQQEDEQRRTRELNNDHDHHELLDREAVKRARELREQVRVMARNLHQLQARILERAIQVAKREAFLITDDILSQLQKQEQEKDDQDDDSANARQDAIDKRREILRQLETALQALTDSIAETMNRGLPRSLRDLRDTFGNIDKSLQKKLQPELLSQIEQAIVSRDNEGRNMRDEANAVSVVVEHEELIDKSAPEFQMAAFLSKY